MPASERLLNNRREHTHERGEYRAGPQVQAPGAANIAWSGIARAVSIESFKSEF